MLVLPPHLPTPAAPQVAAMALSPIAALSLPLVQSPSWQQSMHDFGEKLRQHAQASLNSDGFKQWAASADDGVTFMDWSYKLFGIDLSYVWDPELWVRFKEAVVNDTPALFWNKLWDRCVAGGCGAGAGAVTAGCSCATAGACAALRPACEGLSGCQAV